MSTVLLDIGSLENHMDAFRSRTAILTSAAHPHNPAPHLCTVVRHPLNRTRPSMRIFLFCAHFI